MIQVQTRETEVRVTEQVKVLDMNSSPGKQPPPALPRPRLHRSTSPCASCPPRSAAFLLSEAVNNWNQLTGQS